MGASGWSSCQFLAGVMLSAYYVTKRQEIHHVQFGWGNIVCDDSSILNYFCFTSIWNDFNLGDVFNNLKNYHFIRCYTFQYYKKVS